MSKSLIEKLRKSREIIVQVGGYGFTIRRPTQYQLTEIPDDERANTTIIDAKTGDKKTVRIAKDEAMLRRFVVAWQGVNELDIVPGGDAVPAEFDADLLIEWLQSKPELWKELSSAIWESYLANERSTGESLGEPQTGFSDAS